MEWEANSGMGSQKWNGSQKRSEGYLFLEIFSTSYLIE